MQASLDLAESGYKVYLVEKNPSIGGVMAQLDKTFPTDDCAMCTLAPRMVDCGGHRNIEKLTYSEVLGIDGDPGHFKVQVRKKARSVDLDKCTGCGECAANCAIVNRPYVERPEPGPLDLTPEQVAKLDSIMAEYGLGKEALLPILQDVNAQQKWLSPGAVAKVADALGLPVTRVLRIATFYNALSLEPRGKYVVKVCTGTACHVKGAGRILESLERVLGVATGGTTDDGLFTVEAVRCLGCCGLAPVVTVNDEVYGKVTSASMLKVIKKYAAEGKEAASAEAKS
jgi:NADH:ubiquinone oxidoreductase subunit E